MDSVSPHKKRNGTYATMVYWLLPLPSKQVKRVRFSLVALKDKKGTFMEDRNEIIRGLRKSGKTLENIGEEFHLSKERVRQLTKGIRPLKNKKVPNAPKKVKIPVGFKKCSQCKDTKRIEEFHKDSGRRDGLSVRCAECAKLNSRKANYARLGITIEEYDRLFSKQEGRCAICHRHRNELKQELSIDHNHRNGKVRELLCVKCNSLLGYANDSVELLSNAIDYLKRLEKD